MQLAAILGGEGFADMTMDDIVKLLDCHSQLLNNENLKELPKLAREEEEETDVSQTGLTLEWLAELCNQAQELQKWSRNETKI